MQQLRGQSRAGYKMMFPVTPRSTGQWSRQDFRSRTYLGSKPLDFLVGTEEETVTTAELCGLIFLPVFHTSRVLSTRSDRILSVLGGRIGS